MDKDKDNPDILGRFEEPCRIDASWLKDVDVCALMSVLNDGDGAEPLTMFVGGCVRNALLGEPEGDIDLATKLLPQEVADRCEAAGLRVVPTGIDHGTVTVAMNGRGYEVTTLRRDVATDGRRATVAYADSWVEDARRRDFTMNTLLCDGGGCVYDPLGCGFSDLQARRVVFVGTADRRVAEDVLRILRFFRFYAYYGRGEADAVALKACSDQAEKISELSRERVTQEMKKILMAPRAADVLRLMFGNGVLSCFDEMDLDVFERFCALQLETGHETLFARLFFLNSQDCFDDYFLIGKALRKDMDGLVALMDEPDFGSDHAVQVVMYRYGRDVALQGYLMWCACDGHKAEEAVISLLETWDIPVFPVTGKDLLVQGYQAGPEIGIALRELEQSWLEEGFVLPQGVVQ